MSNTANETYSEGQSSKFQANKDPIWLKVKSWQSKLKSIPKTLTLEY